MEEKLKTLYSTLATVETRGQSTKIMAECLKYLELLIKSEEEKADLAEVKPSPVQ